MEKSDLITIFQHLDKTEIREVRKFVRSPFFNQREDVIRLWDYLEWAQGKKTTILHKYKAWTSIYPDKAFDYKQMKLVMHFLLNTIREYLAYKEARHDEMNWQLHLCRSLRKRQLDKQMNKALRKLNKQQAEQPYRNVGYHYHSYQLELERYEYQHRQRRSGRMNLEELAAELTIFYLADILRHSCTVLTAQNMSQQDYQLELLNEVLQYVERSPVRTTPAVAIYHQAYKALSEPEQEGAFEELLVLIEDHWQKFPPDEAMDIYLLAINYCIRQLNRGHRTYIRKAFDLYRKGLEREVLLDHGVLSKFTYKNVLMLAIGLQEWDWAEAFLEKYKDYLPAKERENIYSYNLAIFYFRKPDYDKAMPLLQQVTFQDVLYNLNARTMLLQIYYELEEFDALDSLLESFRAFIRRHKELGYHKENYTNLISFIRQMRNLPPNAIEEKQRLKMEVEQTASVAEKAWLLRQL